MFNGESLPLRSAIEIWDHVGIQIKGANVGEYRTSLIDDLTSLGKAPLKPQQKLDLLSQSIYY